MNMTKAIFAALLWGVGIAAGSAPASALEVSLDHTLCPIETIGETEVDTWGDALAKSDGAYSDAQMGMLVDAISSCAVKHGWSKDDIASVTDFNLAIISATALADQLADSGVDAVAYESVLEDRSAEELQQIMNDPSNSPALVKLSEMLTADLGSTLTDKMAEDMGGYIALMATAQYASMKMMGFID
jgi:hypothetical protein